MGLLSGETNNSKLVVRNIMEEFAFKKLTSSCSLGQEFHRNHYRKGVKGDWKNYFEEIHKDFFKDRYGELLIKLGYEKDYNW